MTAPAPTQPQQPPPQESQGQQAVEDAAIVAGLAVLLAALFPSLPSIVALLIRPPKRRGEIRVSRIAGTAAARLVLAWSDPTTEPHGAAGARMQRLNIQRRAQYLLAAARRITRQLGPDRSREAVVKALQAERRYWQQHVYAGQKREQAAATADSVAAQDGVQQPTDTRGKVGTVLGWMARMDDRTTAECRAAHGKNWIVERPPRIGLPGTVHVHCRCLPVPPYRTRQLVGGGQLPSIPR